MKRILREPFLHFVLLGILVFAVDATLRQRSAEAGGGEIVVTQGRVENLAALFAKTWQRPATAAELRGLVDNYVLEEALFREGVALGVDQGDTVIRRRVRQKMDLFVDDLVDSMETPEAELEAWLADHSDAYAQPARFTFRQVYLNPDRRGSELRADAERLLQELRSTDGTSDLEKFGDPSLLEATYSDYRADRVESSLGPAFAEHLAGLASGEWSGPVESSFGLHLVFLEAVTPSRIPDLAEVRAEVERDWSRAQREEASVRFYEQIVSRYDVTVDWPQVNEAANLAPEGAQSH
jgi:parvulin-like peptidyl-prolyl isomerase